MSSAEDLAGRTEGFLAKAKAVSDSILRWCDEGDVSIVSHWDADGICAAGVIGLALFTRGFSFKIRFLDSLTEEVVRSLEASELPVVLTDIGAGQLDLLSDRLRGKVAVLDHHQRQGDDRYVQYLNPMDFGFDGGKDLSGSGTAYFVGECITKDADLMPVAAIVGALADMQDKNEFRELRGLNSLIVNRGEDLGVVEVSEDFVFFGRETRPLARALAGTYSMQIPGITGDEMAAYQLLNSLNIPLKDDDKLRSISDLTEDEKQRLTAGLLQVMVSKGVKLPADVPFIGKVYTFTKEDKWSPTRDAREFSFILNSLGRSERFDLAFALVRGYRGSVLEEAQEVSQSYTALIQDAIRAVLSTPGAIAELSSTTVIRGEGLLQPNTLSPLITILSTGSLYSEDKLLVALCLQDDENVKVSCRASYVLVERGVNAGTIMESASKAVGGQGGGHNVAAGATIPRKKTNRFLERVDELVGEALGKNKGEPQVRPEGQGQGRDPSRVVEARREVQAGGS